MQTAKVEDPLSETHLSMLRRDSLYSPEVNEPVWSHWLHRP